MIETIRYDDTVVAIIVYKDHPLGENQIEFITPNEFSLQLGYMNRPVGYQVIPHIHNPVRRETIGTQEVLFIKEGVIKIDFYSFERVYLESRKLSAGDLILLVGAGHGITVLEAATIVEVKNGPFIQGADKGRFESTKR
jgi:hypothetical protein